MCEVCAEIENGLHGDRQRSTRRPRRSMGWKIHYLGYYIYYADYYIHHLG